MNDRFIVVPKSHILAREPSSGFRTIVDKALQTAKKPKTFQRWYCSKCAVEVYDHRCVRCDKLERDKG